MPVEPSSSSEREDRVNEIIAAYLEAREAGRQPSPDEWLGRYPEVAAELASFLADKEQFEEFSGPVRPPISNPPAVHSHITVYYSEETQRTEHAPARRLGDYELLEELGRGGMGVVYQARQISLGRVVALKTILAGGLASAADVVRFRTEAEAVAALDHPNIVPIHEVGEQDGQHYFAMKLIEGGSLAQRLANHGRGCPQEAARLLAVVARAVHHAHERGILHRDLKPGNILVSFRRVPYVTDFGLAKRVDGSGSHSQSGIIGTASYMAPEQAAGRCGRLTTSADVYSLGAILYELLTGRPPFESESLIEALRLLQEEEPVSPRQLNPAVDRDLETICLKCLEKQPARRYASAALLAEDLERYLAGTPVLARPVGTVERLARWVGRRPAAAAAWGLLLLVGVLAPLGAGVTWLWRQAEDQNERMQSALDAAQSAKQREEANRKIADEARTRAETSEGRVKAAREQLAQVSYFYQIHLAYLAWQEGKIARALELLNACPEAQRRWEWSYVQRLCQPELLTLPVGSQAGGHCVAFNPVTRDLAVADGVERKATVWDLDTARPRYTIRHAEGLVRSVAYSPDGRFLVTAATDETVQLWEARTGKHLRIFRGHTHSHVLDAAFSPNGRTIASGAMDGTVRLWDRESGQCERILNPECPIWSVAWSSDGSHLAASAQDGKVHLWDIQGNAPKRTFGPLPAAAEIVAFSPNGRLLAAASRGMDGTIKVWDVASGTEAVTGLGHPQGVFTLAFSPDGRRLVSGSQDTTMRVWNTQTGALVDTLRGHHLLVRSLTYDRAGHRLASVGHDKTVKIWDMTRPPEAQVLTAEGGVRDAAISPDGQTVAVAAGPRGVLLMRADTGIAVRSLAVDAGEQVHAVAFSPDRRHLAAGCDKVVRIWDVDTGRAVHSLPASSLPVSRVRYSRDGRLLGAGCRDGLARLWEVDTGKLVQTIDTRLPPNIRTRKDFFTDLAFSPDGALVATTGEQPVLLVWDVATGKRKIVCISGFKEVLALTFTPDGKQLVGGYAGNDDILFFDLTTGQEVRKLVSHLGGVRDLCYSPSGERLVSCSEDRTIKLWDAATGQEVLTLKGHTDKVGCVSFSADGRRLVSASPHEGTARVWDIGPPPIVYEELARLEKELAAEQRELARLTDLKVDGPVKEVLAQRAGLKQQRIAQLKERVAPSGKPTKL
jgi:WD40 repeat protein